MNVRIASSDGGEFSAYLSVPLKGKGPGIVVLQEIFGANANMRKICDWLASRQFTALCPDMFWRVEPNVELDEDQRERGRALRMKTDDTQAAADAAVCIEFLRRHEACTGRVGVAGYCWGGLLSYLTAVRHRPDAAVGYYGVGIDKKLDQAKNLSCPLMLHYAGQDKSAGPEVAHQVREAFRDDPRVTVWEYPEANHAFARPGGSNFHARSADLADMRTLSFFVETLFGYKS